MANTFPLRLPVSHRQRAIELAEHDGISLNQFIMLAIVEKMTRFEALVEKIDNASFPRKDRSPKQ